MMSILGEIISDQFRVEELIATGSMGSVYRVWDLQRYADQVMKVINPDLFVNPALMGQLRDENLRAMTHPNIVPYYGLYREPEPAFLLRGYVDGVTLTELLDRYPTDNGFPLWATLAVLKAVSAALSHAHNNGVLHTNIKSNNVFIENSGQIRLTDFGVAPDGKSRFADSILFTTAAYWAPEQIQDEELTSAADIYALGILLFQMTTGQVPFKALDFDSDADKLSRQMTMDAHLNQTPPDPRNLTPEISQEMAQVILTALAKSPADRYSNVEELLAAFSEACGVTSAQVPETVPFEALPEVNLQSGDVTLISEKTVRRDPTPAASDGDHEDMGQTITRVPDLHAASEDETRIMDSLTAASPPGRKRFLVPLLIFAGVGLLCLLLVVGGGLGVYFLGGGQNAVANILGQDGPSSEGEITIAPSPVAVEPTHEIGPEDLPTEPLPPTDVPVLTETTVAQAATATLAPTATMIPTTTITQTTAPPTVGGGSGQLAFADFVKEIPQVFVMGLDGSDRQQLTDLSDGACQPDWSPDGEQIVFISPCSKAEHYKPYAGANLWLMNADGSGQEKLPIQAEDGDFDPAWSPDGSQIAFAAVGRVKADVLPHLYVYDIAADSITELLSTTPARAPSWSPDGQQLVFEMTRGEIWVINADGSGPNIIFSTAALISYAPSWSPDGELILFGQQRTPMLVGKTISNRFQDADPVDSILAMRPAWEPEFSPDGEWVLFSHDDALIVLFKVSGSELDVDELGPGFQPDWSP
jgi:eukaryotic-like serine/threonine-protein kinase